MFYPGRSDLKSSGILGFQVVDVTSFSRKDEDRKVARKKFHK